MTKKRDAVTFYIVTAQFKTCNHTVRISIKLMAIEGVRRKHVCQKWKKCKNKKKTNSIVTSWITSIRVITLLVQSLRRVSWTSSLIRTKYFQLLDFVINSTTLISHACTIQIWRKVINNCIWIQLNFQYNYRETNTIYKQCV